MEPIIQPQEKKSGKGLKTAIIILTIVAVVLAGVLLYFRIQSNKIVKDLNTEKEELVMNLQDLRGQYDDLRTSNDTLNAQLELEKERVELMIEKIRKTEATNRTRIREYEKELGTLRDIMRSYIYQIDSLNTLNIQLREETHLARNEARESQEKYQSLVQTTDDLAQKVEKGSVIKARDVNVVGITNKGKNVSKAGSTEKLKTCFTLIENTIATRGPRSVFIRVKGPDGILMTPSENNIFRAENEQLIYSAVREVDYQGEDVEMCIFYGGPGEKFIKGAYTVELFTGGALIGTGQVLLK